MAFFSRTKQNKTTKKEIKQSDSTNSDDNHALPTDYNLAGVLVRPYVTEKAMKMSEKNVHTFIVQTHATKYLVRDAIKSIYNVTPVRINIVSKTPRQYMSKKKGRRLTEKGVRKAYVYLKDGDSINLV